MQSAPPSPPPATAYAPPAAPTAAPRPRGLPAPLAVLWRNRVTATGLIALGLALVGEQLMRALPADPARPHDPALGTSMVQVAVLLVGLVAWVRNSARIRPNAPPARPVSSLPVRVAGDGAGVHVGPARRNGLAGGRQRMTALGDQYRALRARIGWAGTILGLAVVVALAALTAGLLLQDFQDERAPWIWLVTLAGLVLTFVGVRPKAGGLMPHDPAEPADDPPMTRGEWLLLGVIMLVTVAVRLWSLDTIPMGPYTDEGDRAYDARHINQGVPVVDKPFIFFGTGWWGVPNLYFWLVGRSLVVFGDSLGGARMIHALAGIATVWFTYRLGRTIWSPRAGLLAGALLAVSDFAIQFSRTAGESTTTLFTWTVCFYYLYRAIKTARPLDFVLSGIAGGLTLYGYASGKLLPVFLVPLALYLLLRWRGTGFRRYLPGLVLMALAAGLTYAPNGLYILSHLAVLTERYNGVSIFNYPDLYQQQIYHTTNWASIIAQQFGVAYRAFDVGTERGPFYPTNQPILPVPWAALWVLGTAYMVWRAGDVRFAVLGTWLLGGLAGAALTNDTPTLQRVATMVPLLALIPAVFLDRVGSGIPALRRGMRLWPAARVTRLAYSGLLLVAVVLLGIQTLGFYFGPYTAQGNYYWYTLAGRYAEHLDPQRNKVYHMDVPEFFWSLGPALFLAKDVPAGDLVNLDDEVPFTSDDGATAHFLVYPSNAQYLSMLKTYYPNSTTEVTNRPDGTLFFTAVRVTPADFATRRTVTARYGPPAGPLFERSEPRLGTAGADAQAALAPPAGMRYPLGAQWAGGLVVPDYGTYRLAMTAPGGASLEIDGRRLMTATVGSNTPTETHLVLAKGVHTVRLAGTLSGPETPLELRWGTDAGMLVPIAPSFLWNGPLGAFQGQAYPAVEDITRFTAPDLNLGGLGPLTERHDGFLGWQSVTDKLRGGDRVFARWVGTFHVPSSGDYLFDAAYEQGRMNPLSLFVDGKIVAGSGVEGSPNLPITVPLSAGAHTLDVRFNTTMAGPPFQLFWQPPGGTRELLPPTVLDPVPSGAWTTAERPGVGAIDAGLIGAAAPTSPVRVDPPLGGAAGLKEPRGVGVLPDGSIVVGDTGNHRVVKFDSTGRQVAAWGAEGTGDTQFGAISDLAVRGDGVIAVLDAGNNDIQLFDASGTLITHARNDMVGIASSSGIAWGPEGRMYVADTAGGRILRVFPDGKPDVVFHDGDATHQPIDQPVDVAVTPDGVLYAVDLRDRIVRFNPAGQIDREWPLPIGRARGGSHMTLWGNRLIVTNPDDNSLTALDLQTGTLRRLQATGTASLDLKLPIGVAAGGDGHLYVVDSDNARVVVLAGAAP
ncbi:MAG TPA: glycosyltransferase family 39 protein [Chloroflexia bacterium]|nr:glycosyltransferase family 39 protein [Chloroflexia bacterium]